MIKVIITIALNLVITLCHVTAQNQDVFGPTTIYITDAIGNIDSVTVGWLERESSADMTELGEENIVVQPWDTILEARLANGPIFGSRPTVERKTYYFNVEFNNSPGVRRCPHIVGAPILLIHAEHLPVTIRWDSTFFIDNPCFWYSAFVNHDIWTEVPSVTTTIDVWKSLGADSLDHHCMIAKSIYVTDLSPKPEETGWTDFTYDHYLANGDTVTNGALAIVPDVLYSCTTRPTVTVASLPHNTINLYPNPAIKHITLDAPDIKDIKRIVVVDIKGKVVIDRHTDLPDRLSDYVLTIPDDVHGIVIVQVITDEGTWTEKVLVE